MLERLRRALIESYIGAIALGWIFAQAIQHFTYIFASPVASWISRRQYAEMPGVARWPTRLFLREAIPEAITTFLLLAVGYVLLHWLYLRNSTTTATNADIADAPPLSEG